MNWKIKQGGLKFWWRHNVVFSQNFPWPGWWRTIKDPYYRKVYLDSGSLPHDIFQVTYQKFVKKFI